MITAATARRTSTPLAVGEVVNTAIETHPDAVVAGRLVSMVEVAKIPKRYVAVDCAGVPMLPKETEWPGKGPDGRAQTREAKLGCMFTQTKVDDKGLIRDPDSSSCVGTLESVGRLGSLVYAEARRSGLEHVDEVIVIGDGAP